MRAVVYKKYGEPDVLQLIELESPIPKSNEVLIKVEATSVTAGDVRLRASNFPPLFWLPARLIFGLIKPKKQILGHEFSGTIVKLGDQVTRFAVGDEVFGTTSMLKTGAYAEYVSVPESWNHGVVNHKPKNISFKEASILPIGAMTALYLLKKATLYKGKKVLIYGVSGSVGSYALQIAKHYGAEVTGVCSTRNIEMVTSLGADSVIDYLTTDISKTEAYYDIVFDAVGKLSKTIARSLLSNGGHIVSTKMITKESLELLDEIKSMVELEAIHPFIDKAYSLEEIRKAHAYVETGRKRGNIVITI